MISDTLKKIIEENKNKKVYDPVINEVTIREVSLLKNMFESIDKKINLICSEKHNLFIDNEGFIFLFSLSSLDFNRSQIFKFNHLISKSLVPINYIDFIYRNSQFKKTILDYKNCLDENGISIHTTFLPELNPKFGTITYYLKIKETKKQKKEDFFV